MWYSSHYVIIKNYNIYYFIEIIVEIKWKYKNTFGVQYCLLGMEFNAPVKVFQLKPVAVHRR